MTQVISPELDLTEKINNHSQLLFRQISPQGANSVTTSITSSVGPTEFIIPPSVFRLDRSRINFTLQCGSTAKANFINGNLCSSISRITLYDSATNALWADISNVNLYSALVTPAGTSFDEFSTKSYALTTGSTAAAALANSVEDISKSNTSNGSVNDNGLDTDLTPYNPYFGRKQFYVTAVSTDTFLDVSIPLSAFKMSILASEKMMYSPSNLTLQVYWGANNNYTFKATAVGSPVTGAESQTAPVALTNISLSLATEQNLKISSQIINQVMSQGITLPFAYPTVTLQSLSASTAHSYQLQATRAYGNSILAFITGAFQSGGTVNTNTVHIRGEISLYNTFINSQPLKYSAGFNALASQDFYLGNREYLKKSVVQSLGEYVNAEWVHIDSFFGEKPLCEVDQHARDGLDVTTESKTWQIQANLANATAYRWTTIIIGQKVLMLTASGSQVM